MSRYVPDKLAGVDQAAAAFDGEIRDFVRRKAEFPFRQRGEHPMSVDPATEKPECADPARRRRIDGGNRPRQFELQGIRNLLRSEGERVCRDISAYASLNHASTTAMKVIADSLEKWKGTSADAAGVGRKNR